MTQVALFSIGNALIDQEFKVSDDFLTQQGIQKGTMQLTFDQPAQHALYEQLQATQQYKGQASGGSAANTTVAFSALGGHAFYACRVGQDELGQFYLNGLNAANVQTSTRSISTGVTGTCMVLISPDSERTMQTFLGTTADLSDTEIDYTALSSAAYLYIEGYLSTSDSARSAVKKARAIARENNVKIALSLSDPAMVQYARQGLNELIDDGLDLLFCNEQEALMYTETTTLADATQALLKLSQMVVITLGAKGVHVATGSECFVVAGREVVAVDANGAGDAFAGAFLYALQQQMNLTDAAKLAILVSSEVVAHYGPRLDNARYGELLQQFKA